MLWDIALTGGLVRRCVLVFRINSHDYSPARRVTMERAEKGFLRDLAVWLRSRIRVGRRRSSERMVGASHGVEQSVELNAMSETPASQNIVAPAGQPGEASQPGLDLAGDPREAVPNSRHADPTFVIVDSDDGITIR
jgi:hypothetical protein